MKVRKILLALIVMTGLIMTGCEPQSQPSETPAVEPTSTSAPQNTLVPETANSLNNTGWLLENLNGQAVLAETQVTINFENDKFYGTDGCNQYNGSVKLDGEKISIDEKIATTRMACEESVMQQGSDYLYMLVQAATYKVNGQQMLLLDIDGKTLATFTQMLTMTGKDPQNATYLIDSKAITLINGVSEVEASPGSATKLVTSYFGNGVEIDLNGDGVMDSAFLLEQTSGGSGTFYYVVAALNMPDGYVGTNAIIIGDRIAPQNLNIDPDNSTKFIVNYMDRKPDEPMTTQPSVGVSRWFNLQDNMLVEITSPLASSAIDPQNATYLIEDKPITLVNGVSEVEAAPGSATKLVTSYFGNGVEIDLNGDGVMDSAFLLEQTSGAVGPSSTSWQPSICQMEP